MPSILAIYIDKNPLEIIDNFNKTYYNPKVSILHTNIYDPGLYYCYRTSKEQYRVGSREKEQVKLIGTLNKLLMKLRVLHATL